MPLNTRCAGLGGTSRTSYRPKRCPYRRQPRFLPPRRPSCTLPPTPFRTARNTVCAGTTSGRTAFPTRNTAFPTRNTAFPTRNTAFPSRNTAGFPTRNTAFPTRNAAFPSRNTGFPPRKHSVPHPQHGVRYPQYSVPCPQYSVPCPQGSVPYPQCSFPCLPATQRSPARHLWPGQFRWVPLSLDELEAEEARAATPHPPRGPARAYSAA